MHITFSCHQQNTFGDLLQKLLPAALETAMEEDVEFRSVASGADFSFQVFFRRKNT
jgi:hypothetical protein